MIVPCRGGAINTHSRSDTHAFRTEIDYKAHKAAAHSKNRAEARQNRQIDIQFNYAPRQQRRNDGEWVSRGLLLIALCCCCCCNLLPDFYSILSEWLIQVRWVLKITKKSNGLTDMGTREEEDPRGYTIM